MGPVLRVGRPQPQLGRQHGLRLVSNVIEGSDAAAAAGTATAWTWGDLEGACHASPPSIGALEAK